MHEVIKKKKLLCMKMFYFPHIHKMKYFGLYVFLLNSHVTYPY